jgi:MYXO-CTERM domain-containing protein
MTSTVLQNSLATGVLAGMMTLMAVTSSASTIVYDLQTDWSNSSNPNGPWTYRQGTAALPFQPDLGDACCTPTDGIGGAWAPGQVSGNFLPFWAQAVADTPGYLSGDVLVHSVSSPNGNTALGEANVIWTAPTSGVIDITGGLWYAQWALQRSNDFTLTLGATLLAQGTVSFNDIYDRSSPLTFALSGLTVNAGDVLMLTVQRSAGFANGTIAGLNLTVTQTPSSAVPEPSGALLALTGLALLRLGRRRSRPST